MRPQRDDGFERYMESLTYTPPNVEVRERAHELDDSPPVSPTMTTRRVSVRSLTNYVSGAVLALGKKLHLL